jgi:hypothetical protein
MDMKLETPRFPRFAAACHCPSTAHGRAHPKRTGRHLHIVGQNEQTFSGLPRKRTSICAFLEANSATRSGREIRRRNLRRRNQEARPVQFGTGEPRHRQRLSADWGERKY